MKAGHFAASAAHHPPPAHPEWGEAAHLGFEQLCAAARKPCRNDDCLPGCLSILHHVSARPPAENCSSVPGFTQAEAGGGDFDQFVVGDVFHGLFQGELAWGDEAEGLVGPAARILVSFFSLVMLTRMSSEREFSPTIIPA